MARQNKFRQLLREITLIGCFFLSGSAALIYEICWIRQASLVFGSTVYAVTTVLAVFFLGLALGSEVAGRVARRHGHPLRLFAVLEILLGMVALLSPYGFQLADDIQRSLYPTLSVATSPMVVMRLALLALLLLPPTLIMGTSLPLFVRQFTQSESRIERSVGFLYGINTLGAAAGCATAGFILIPAIGIAAAIQLGAAINIVVGIIVGLISVPAALVPPVGVRRSPRLDYTQTLVAVLVFASGMVALGNEVLWIRHLSLLIRNSVYTYTITLSVVLCGIVIGSLLVSKFCTRVSRRALLFGAIHILLAIIVTAVMRLSPQSWHWLGGELYVYVVLLLPPAILSGAAFPLAVRLMVDDPVESSFGVGRLYAANTLGGIAGSLIVGFLALPYLGLAISITLTTGLSLATGLAAWLFLEQDSARGRRRVLGATAFGAAWLAIPLVVDTRIPADFLADRGKLVDYREGLNANVAVVRDKGVHHLELDRWWQGSNAKNHQAVAAHIPMLLHPNPRSVLVVGAGTGQTPSRFLMYNIARLDCVDIEPQVFEVIRNHFDNNWMQDPRVTLLRDDGRNYLSLTDATYDIISLEVGQIFRPGVASFYTTEFYQRARARLRPDGLIAQFVPLPFFTLKEFQMVVRTFMHTFPASVLWYNTSELLLIGVNGDQLSVHPDRLELLTDNRRVNEDLRYSHWGGPTHWLHRRDAFLAGFLTGPDTLAAWTKGAPVYRDDRPILEYAASLASDLRASEISIVEQLRHRLDEVDQVLGLALDEATKSSIEALRKANLGDIVASARIRQATAIERTGDYTTIAALLTDALDASPDHVVANRMMGDVQVPLGRVSEALRYYHKAYALRPDDPLVRRGLGYALHRLGRVDEAIAHYRFALQAWPDDADSHNNLGAALASRGDSGEAREHFETALSLRPDFSDARRNLTRARKGRGQSQ